MIRVTLDLDVPLMYKDELQAFKEKVNAPVYGISAVTRQGLPELLQAIEDQLKDLPKPEPIAFEPFEYLSKDASQFEIMRDDDGTFVVVGGFVDRLARNVVVDDPESFAYFQKAIKLAGYDGAELSAIQGMCEHIVLDAWETEAPLVKAAAMEAGIWASAFPCAAPSWRPTAAAFPPTAVRDTAAAFISAWLWEENRYDDS